MLVILLAFIALASLLYLAGLITGMVICLFIFLLLSGMFTKFYKRCRLFLTNTPALILTHNELIDNINLQKFRWTDIKDISSASIQMKTRINYIAISLVDPEKYISIIISPYTRFMARLNEKYFGGAFSIQPNIVKCDNSELLASLINYHNSLTDQPSR